MLFWISHNPESAAIEHLGRFLTRLCCKGAFVCSKGSCWSNTGHPRCEKGAVPQTCVVWRWTRWACRPSVGWGVWHIEHSNIGGGAGQNVDGLCHRRLHLFCAVVAGRLLHVQDGAHQRRVAIQWLQRKTGLCASAQQCSTAATDNMPNVRRLKKKTLKTSPNVWLKILGPNGLKYLRTPKNYSGRIIWTAYIPKLIKISSPQGNFFFNYSTWFHVTPCAFRKLFNFTPLQKNANVRLQNDSFFMIS